MAAVTDELIGWLRDALNRMYFGEVILTVHEGKVTKIDTRVRTRVPQPKVDVCNDRGVDSET